MRRKDLGSGKRMFRALFVFFSCKVLTDRIRYCVSDFRKFILSSIILDAINDIDLRKTLKSILRKFPIINVNNPYLYMYLGETIPLSVSSVFWSGSGELGGGDACAYLMESCLTAALVDSKAAFLTSSRCWLSTPAL